MINKYTFDAERIESTTHLLGFRSSPLQKRKINEKKNQICFNKTKRKEDSQEEDEESEYNEYIYVCIWIYKGRYKR